MKIKFLYTALVLGCFTLASCEKKSETASSSDVTTTHSETPSADLSAADLINNPNTANPEAVPAGPAPVMTFGESVHDFGNIKAGDIVKHTFSFKNTGKAPLIIESATATCGCTIPNYPKEPVAPGEEGKIDVQFNSTGKTGQQNKVITIRANTQPNITELTIKTNIQQ
jgi:outer membrane biosynthesis protein TonB